MHHTQHHDDPAADGGAHYGHPPDGAYFATLLVLLLLTALLLRGIAPACFTPTFPGPWKGSSRPPVLHPPRGPTAPVLQVFRL